MNADARRWLSAGAWIALFFSVLAAITLIADHFVTPSFDGRLKTSVESTLRLAAGDVPIPGNPVDLASLTDLSARAWISLRGGKPSGYIFLVRVTGNAGPWPAVFTYDPNLGVDFVGIVGENEGLSSPLRYGVSSRIIESWKTRLQSIAIRLEAQR